jgi:hypothetical protein
MTALFSVILSAARTVEPAMGPVPVVQHVDQIDPETWAKKTGDGWK